jgi:transposase
MLHGRFQAAGLNWPLPDEMTTDATLEARLFPEAGTRKGHRRQIEPAWGSIHRERKLSILWDEYIARNPEGYGYSRFCELYRIWEGGHDAPDPRGRRQAVRRLRWRHRCK